MNVADALKPLPDETPRVFRAYPKDREGSASRPRSGKRKKVVSLKK